MHKFDQLYSRFFFLFSVVIFPLLYKDYQNTKAVISNVSTAKYILTENMVPDFIDLILKDVEKIHRNFLMAFHINVLPATIVFLLGVN